MWNTVAKCNSPFCRNLYTDIIMYLQSPSRAMCRHLVISF